MTKGLNIELQGLDNALKAMKGLSAKALVDVKDEMNAFGQKVVLDAKQLAPTDEGKLKNSISYKLNGLDLEITVAANYAAYVEFGTRRYASEQVASLPPDWKAFAAQFKGKGGGSMDEFLLRIIDWVGRKGLAGTYSVKTGRRTGSKSARAIEDAEAAYPIALAILRNGVKAHPFLYPAYDRNVEKFINNLKRALQQ